MVTAKTACILCSRNCGLTVEIENGKFVKIHGDEQHPISQGYICQKAARLEHYQNHDDRLGQPLKRQADGSFTPLSWEVALEEIAEKLKQIKQNYSGHAFAFVGGGGQGMLTAGHHCEPFTKTPYHKYVPVRIIKLVEV